MTASDPSRNPIEVIAEEFLEACRNGESPSVEDYAERHSEIGEDLRSLLPTIAALEGLKVDHDDSGRKKALIGPGMQERLGDYLILEEIGRGGMGIVYLAEQQSLGRQVALKVLPRQSLADDIRLQRFELEAQTAARLHHTNIVPIFGVGEQDGFHYYVMQYIRGLGLDEIVRELSAPGSSHPDSATDVSPSNAVSSLRNGKFEPAPSNSGSNSEHQPTNKSPSSQDIATAPHLQAKGDQIYWHSVARIGAQVADALEYAHVQGTLHRDIKPANLLLDAHGVVWITDFGLAKAIEGPSLTRSTDIVGTLQYMPPEQMGGNYDARSDIYCLGLSLYELLTFQPAFPETDQRKLLAKGEPLRPSKIRTGIPRDLETIVQKAIAHDPRHRYASARELHEDLQAFLSDRPIRARRATAPEQLMRWCRRNRAIAVFALITFVTLVTAGVSGWVSASRAKNAEIHATQRADEARDARERAEQTLTLALALLDDVFESISGPDIIRPVAESLDTEGLDEEERTALESAAAEPRFRPVVSERDTQLLERLLTFYDKFAETNSIDGKLQREIADAQRRVGDLQQRLGRYDDAINAYDRALSIYNALAAEPGQSKTYLSETAILHNEIGQTCLASGSPTRVKRVRKEHAAVLKLTSDLPRVRYEQARAHLALGNLLQKKRHRPREDRRPPDRDRTGRRGRGQNSRRPSRPRNNPEERRHYMRAYKLCERLLTEDSSNPSKRLLAARSARDLGHAIDPSNTDKTAEELYEQAITSLKLLVMEFPGTPYYRYELASTYSMVRPRRDQGWKSAERTRLENARTILDSLVSEDGSVIEYRAALARTQKEIARLEQQSGNDSEVEAQLRAVLQHETILTRARPNSLQFQLDRVGTEFELARCLVKQDRSADARATLESSLQRIGTLAKELKLPRGRRLPFNRHIHLLTRIYEQAGELEAARALQESTRSMRRSRKR